MTCDLRISKSDSLHRRPACARPPPPRLSLIQKRLPVINTESKAKLLPSGTGSAIAPSSWNVRFSRLFWSTPLFLMDPRSEIETKTIKCPVGPKVPSTRLLPILFVVRSSFYLTSEQASDIRQPLSSDTPGSDVHH